MKRKILVAGCGISGIGAAGMLLEAGEQVILYDGNTALDPDSVLSSFEDARKPELVLGELTDALADSVKACVISPGISPEVPFAAVLKAHGVPILSEIEAAWKYEKGTVAAITGTNGKTTTTSLTGAILAAAFGKDRTFVVGNIGTAYTGKVLQTREDTVTVAEISSFQLETADTFHPHVSAILNITPDHLNRHKTMENYIAVKESITRNQTKEDFCILNYDDPVLRGFGQTACPASVVWFSSREELDRGFFMRGDALLFRQDNEEFLIGRTEDFHLVGRCNYENILAAAAIGLCMGVSPQVIADTAREFRAVEHRIEFTAVRKGVKYYNDSKATNPDAAIQGIRAMTVPTCLIGGGYDKGSEYDEWISEFGNTVKYLVLIGATAKAIADCCERHGFHSWTYADSMEEAVSLCAGKALPGEAVLLSPACASWGMFRNYEERGRIFKELVRNLPDD